MKVLSYNALYCQLFGAEWHDDYRHNTAQEANATVLMSDFQSTFRSDNFFASAALLKFCNDYKGIINNQISDKAFKYYRTCAEFALGLDQ